MGYSQVVRQRTFVRSSRSRTRGCASGSWGSTSSHDQTPSFRRFESYYPKRHILTASTWRVLGNANVKKIIMVPWCSWLTHLPVMQKIASSNLVGIAKAYTKCPPVDTVQPFCQKGTLCADGGIGRHASLRSQCLWRKGSKPFLRTIRAHPDFIMANITSVKILRLRFLTVLFKAQVVFDKICYRLCTCEDSGNRRI